MATDVASAAAEVASIESAGAPSLPADTAAGMPTPSAEPLREDQIANAVAFLSNPKVVSLLKPHSTRTMTFCRTLTACHDMADTIIAACRQEMSRMHRIATNMCGMHAGGAGVNRAEAQLPHQEGLDGPRD